MSHVLAEQIKKASKKFSQGDEVFFGSRESSNRSRGKILRIMDAGYLVILPIGSSPDSKPTVLKPMSVSKKKSASRRRVDARVP